MPDEELLSAADRGKLSEPVVFKAQIRRMLADPKARALTQSFAVPWTRLKFFNRARPSTDHFPTFTRKLRDAMLQEATTFRTDHTAAVGSVDEAIEAAADGFASLPFAALGPDGEARANEAGVSVRCLLGPDGGPAAADEGEATMVAVLGRAY